jgi:hypothetical protein
MSWVVKLELFAATTTAKHPSAAITIKSLFIVVPRPRIFAGNTESNRGGILGRTILGSELESVKPLCYAPGRINTRLCFGVS